MRNAHCLSVLLLSDGRPGHYRQSEGIVAALRRGGEVDLHRIELATRMAMPKGFIPKLARMLPPTGVLRLIHGLDSRRLKKPNIVVSAGGSTVGANVALARLWAVPNVFSGSTRGFSSDAFRLIVTPYASVGGRSNVIACPKPTPFDPDRVPRPRGLRNLQDFQGARVSLLIGGATPYANFETDDWVRLAALVKALTENWRCQVTIVTSPRTPPEARNIVVEQSVRNNAAVSVVDFMTGGPGSIEATFDCDLILVTSDSLSMMTEAAVSRRPAIALAPNKVRPFRDDEAVAGLVASRWLAVLSLSKADPCKLAREAISLTPAVDNHLDRLLELLRSAIDLHRSPASPAQALEGSE